MLTELRGTAVPVKRGERASEQEVFSGVKETELMWSRAAEVQFGLADAGSSASRHC